MAYKISSYILKTINDNGELILKNTLTQKMLKVKTEDIVEVESILGKNHFNDQLDEVESVLYSNGFIVDDYVDEGMIIDYIFNNEIYGNNVLELTIIPTNACNFDCVYCYQKEPYFYMSEETINNIVKFLEKHINEYSGLLVSWFGGEPLLAKEIMISVMSRIREICLKNKKPFYSNVTTNGYELDLFTFKKLVFNHVRYFQITIDGPREIHNLQRPHKLHKDSFDRIIQNLFNIKQEMSRYNYRIAIRVNVSSLLKPYLKEFVEFLYQHFGNDKHFTIVWEFVRDWGGEKIGKNKNLLFENKSERKWLDILSNKGFAINMGLEQNDLTVALCTASKKNGFVINHDGQVYKCAMIVENDEMKDLNHVGSITPNGNMELDIGKMVKWLGRNRVEDKCVKCKHYPECMGITCPLGTRILNQENRCGELFLYNYESLLRNRDVVRNIDYVK